MKGAAEASTTVPNHVETTTSLASSAPTGSAYGQQVTFTATVSANLSVLGTPTGSVDFVDSTLNVDLGSVPLSNGSATLSTANLTIGSHVITANYTAGSAGSDAADRLLARDGRAWLPIGAGHPHGKQNE